MIRLMEDLLSSNPISPTPQQHSNPLTSTTIRSLLCRKTKTSHSWQLKWAQVVVIMTCFSVKQLIWRETLTTYMRSCWKTWPSSATLASKNIKTTMETRTICFCSPTFAASTSWSRSIRTRQWSRHWICSRSRGERSWMLTKLNTAN